MFGGSAFYTLDFDKIPIESLTIPNDKKEIGTITSEHILKECIINYPDNKHKSHYYN